MSTAPYDQLGTVLSTARVKVNDAILNAGAGQTLTNNASFTGLMVNVAWRNIQNRLRAVGFTGFARLKDDLIVSAIPASSSSDPGVNNSISWSAFYNGAVSEASPVLPQEFLSPLVCWERPNQNANGLSSAQNFTLMSPCLNGIPTNGPKQSRNLNWEWIDDQIRIPGSTVVWDLRLRCLTYLSDLAPGGVATATTPVPIMDCLEPLSDLIAFEFVNPRGDLDAKAFSDAADIHIAEIYGRDTAQMKAIQKPSEYGTMRSPYTPGQVAPPVAPQGPAQGGNQ